MHPYNLLATTEKDDFLNLGFVSFFDAPEEDPRLQYFELKINDVTISVDAWRKVEATVENKTIPLVADTIEELKDWIEFITLMKN